MAKQLWEGVSGKPPADSVNEFQSSILVDSRMIAEDIAGSIAHAFMLGETGIIQKSEADALIAGLEKLANDIKSGKTKIDYGAEDVHTFVENALTKALGDLGKKLHTARSRNDQVALDLRLYLLNRSGEVEAAVSALLSACIGIAEREQTTVMPGYTHLQAAQPITFAHHMLCYASMLVRDLDRLSDWKKRTAVSPLGSGALAGTTHPIDRGLTAQKLGLTPCLNSLDGVSDRDFCIELAGALSILMMHLSRLSEEIVLWCSQPYRFVALDDAYSTGSSIMPQKKNPDVAELVRGKTGRCYGNLMTILTVMKALPLAYNKDMQEDKACIFDSVDTVLACLPVFTEMLLTMTVNRDRCKKAAGEGFINATDCADYLAKKGMPFRDAYKTVGKLVAYASENGLTLETVPIEKYQEFSQLFTADIYAHIDLNTCVFNRKSYGGAGDTKRQIDWFKAFLKEKGV